MIVLTYKFSHKLTLLITLFSLLSFAAWANGKMQFSGVKITRNANKFISRLEKQNWINIEDNNNACHLIGILHNDTTDLYISKNNSKVKSVHVVIDANSPLALENTYSQLSNDLMSKYGIADAEWTQDDKMIHKIFCSVWNCKNGTIVLRKHFSALESKISLLYTIDSKPSQYIQPSDIVVIDKSQALKHQFTSSNTIYEIKHDVDLGGEVLVFPDNCVVKFNGGRITNGEIVFNNTSLINPVFFNISRYRGIVSNQIINAADFPCENDLEALSFLFNQIASSKTIILEKRKYKIDWAEIPVSLYTMQTLNRRTFNSHSWLYYENVHNFMLNGNGAQIEIVNTNTRRYENILLFKNTYGLCITNLSIVGDANYFKTGNDYGVNFLKLVGDNTAASIHISASNIAIPIYSGDYYGNDGAWGLLNSYVSVAGTELKYGSRIHHANNSTFVIENSYGHRGIYLGGGIYDCRVSVSSKYLDTSAAVLMGATPVNGKIQGARNVEIFTYDTGTISDMVSILPGRVYINSLGGEIDNRLFARDYHVYFTDIKILSRYSPSTDISTNYSPLIFDTQGVSDTTGRDLVPLDIKDVQCTMILEDGISTGQDRSVINVLTNYNGKNDSIKLNFKIINNSSNKNLVYTGYIHCQDDMEINISSDQRFTLYQWASNSDYDLSPANFAGKCKIRFVDTKDVFIAAPPKSRVGIAMPDKVYLENVQSYTNRGPSEIVVIK